MNRLFLFLGVCCFLLASVQGSPAAPDASTGDALAAAKTWMALIDAGQYEQSYDIGCRAFHNKVTKNTWVQVLTALRPPYGEVVNRKESNQIYKPDGFEGLEGECLIIMFDTSFKKLDAAREVVVLKREDGVWRGAGYLAGPKPAQQADAETPPAPTQTQVQDQHVQPTALPDQ